MFPHFIQYKHRTSLCLVKIKRALEVHLLIEATLNGRFHCSSITNMPTICEHCDSAGTSCEIDLRSGRCCECIRCGRKCNILITREEWVQLKDKKAGLERTSKDEEDTRLELMARRLQLRKRLANLWGKEAKTAEKELEAIVQDEEHLERNAVEANISFTRSPLTPIHTLRMSPQEWAITERMPAGFWGLPGPQAPISEDAIFEQFESA